MNLYNLSIESTEGLLRSLCARYNIMHKIWIQIDDVFVLYLNKNFADSQLLPVGRQLKN